MKNCELEVKGNVLTIRVDLSKNQGRSKSGKSAIVGTTSGNVPVEGHPGVFLGVNCYKSA